QLALAGRAVEVVELREGHPAVRAGAELDAVRVRQPARIANDGRVEVRLVERVVGGELHRIVLDEERDGSIDVAAHRHAPPGAEVPYVTEDHRQLLAGPAVEPVLRLVLRRRVALVERIDVAVVRLGVFARGRLDRAVPLLLRIREHQVEGGGTDGRRRRSGRRGPAVHVAGSAPAATREEQGKGVGGEQAKGRLDHRSGHQKRIKYTMLYWLSI